MISDCPKQISKQPVPSPRVDCHPEEGPTRALCEARGCCWAPHPTFPRAPPCFFPAKYGYYATDPIEFDGHNTWSANLTKYDTPSLYGGDIDYVALTVQQQGNHRLHLKVKIEL